MSNFLTQHKSIAYIYGKTSESIIKGWSFSVSADILTKYLYFLSMSSSSDFHEILCSAMSICLCTEVITGMGLSWNFSLSLGFHKF